MFVNHVGRRVEAALKRLVFIPMHRVEQGALGLPKGGQIIELRRNSRVKESIDTMVEAAVVDGLAAMDSDYAYPRP